MAAPNDTDLLTSLLKNWNVDVANIFPDAYIAGSPERTLQRMVIVDSEEQMFALEEISPQAVTRKREIATLLAALSTNGLSQVHPYLQDRKGDSITVWDGRCWQLRPYIPGEFLPRPEYLEEPWRGAALADFLIAMRQAMSKFTCDLPVDPFSIVHFINTLVGKLSIYHPEILCELTSARSFLEDEFFPIHDTLPQTFCHGDYHPLNVIWSADSILSVIDWEFCGVKPESYDLALLIGCIGVEDPQVLTGPLVQSLLRRIRENGIYAELSLKTLPELVMALRFAWLSEWLRKTDEEMVRLELDYLHLLLDNRSVLTSAWR